MADAKRLVPDGNFLEASLWIRPSQTSNCHSRIATWLNDADYGNLTSGIASLESDGDNSAVAYFDFSGRRMAVRPSKGVYIVKGKDSAKKHVAR